MARFRRSSDVMLTKRRARPKSRYDAERAKRAIDFIELLPHVKGRQWANQKIKLRPWQAEPLRDIFGVLRPDGTRQYRIVYWEIPKKNSKSTIAACVANYLLFADNELGAEVYSAAYDRDQASIVFDIAKAMVERTPALKKLAKIQDYKKRIEVPSTGSFYRAVEREAAGQHGFNISGLIFDEFHTQRSRELWDTLKEGTALRAQPLIFIITTAGFNRETVCWELHQYARKILDGVVEDPEFYPIIYSAASDEDMQDVDWQDESVWKKANPALGDFLPLEQIRGSARRAAEITAEQNEFKRLRLNIWTQQLSRWIPIDKWDECQTKYTEADLYGRKCYAALDLGAVSDLSAMALLFEDEDGVMLLLRAWCPEERLQARDNDYRSSYRVWAEEGWLTVTPGDVQDYAYIKKQVIEDAERFEFERVDGRPHLVIDRYFQSHHIAQELDTEGLIVSGMSQTPSDMNAPTREFEERVRKGEFRHNGNPLFRWSLDNVMIRYDANGNMKPDKKNSGGKIDPVVATIMALGRLIVAAPSLGYVEDSLIVL